MIRLILISILFAPLLWAQTPELGLDEATLRALQQDDPLRPPPTDGARTGNESNRGVTLRRHFDGRVEEQRVNGELQQFRVRPTGEAPAYYLLNSGGRRGLERRDSDTGSEQSLIPAWRIRKW